MKENYTIFLFFSCTTQVSAFILSIYDNKESSLLFFDVNLHSQSKLFIFKNISLETLLVLVNLTSFVAIRDVFDGGDIYDMFISFQKTFRQPIFL